jgi:hypothetical protein
VLVSGEHHMVDREMAQRLWALAEQLTAGYLPSA